MGLANRITLAIFPLHIAIILMLFHGGAPVVYQALVWGRRRTVTT